MRESNKLVKTFLSGSNKSFVVMKYSLLAAVLIGLGVYLVSAFTPVASDDVSILSHTATAELEPEWSPANSHVDYSVEFCWISGDDINEVRIYRNNLYTNFECEDKPGWEKLYINTYPACFYIASDSSDYLNSDHPCETFYFSAHTPAEGCDFTWKFETRDVNDYWQYEYDKTSVDDVEPMIIKTLGEPKIENGETWITQHTPINIEVYDQGVCGISDIDYCEYRYDVDGIEVLPWTQIVWDAIIGDNPPHYKFTFFYNEDSLHHLEIRCYDNAGNMAYHTQDERVDGTPPETEKCVSDPKKIAPNPKCVAWCEDDCDGEPECVEKCIDEECPIVEWIDGVTEVTLNPVDPDPTGENCNIGVDKTWYMNVIDLTEELCWNPDKYCVPNTGIPSPYVDGTECINKAQDYCVEEMGYDPYTEDWYDCVEGLAYGECEVDPLWKLYRGEPINKTEESCHLLQYFSIDELGNIENMNVNCFFVDLTPPVPSKIVGDPKVPMPYNEFQTIGDGTADWTDLEKYFGDYSARLYVLDGSTDIAAIEFDVDIALEDITELSFWQKIANTYGVNVILGIDADGDGIYESQDKPWHFSHDPADLGDDSFIEMDGMSPSTGNWEEVDTLTISQWWTPNNAGDGFCPEMGWNYLSDAQSESKCRIEPTDHVKVIRLLIGGSGTWMNKEAYVDDITLNGKTIILEPKNWWLTQQTPITLDCTDPQPHPSGDEEVCYKVSFDGKPSDLTENYCEEFGGEMEECWCCADVADPVYIPNGIGVIEPNVYTLYFMEDSLHDLEYFCRDAVEKESVIDKEWFRVDSQPPIITKTMIGTDHLGECPPGPTPTEPCYVADNGSNGVRIDVIDDNTYGCAVNDVSCSYELWWGGNVIDSGNFGEEGKDIIFTEDSEHVLIIECEDALGNSVTDEELFLVDSTPPVTTKTIGEPLVEDVFPKGCEPYEYVYNGGFETGDTEGWTVSDGHVYATTKAAHSGSYGIYFEPIGDCHDDYIKQEVSIPAEATDAKLTFWLRTPNFDSGFDYIAIYFGGDLLLQEWYPPLQWTSYTFDVGSYAGQIGTLELKFVKSETTDCIFGSDLMLDDVSISNCGFTEWINSSTPITLEAEDVKVGVDKIWYKDRVLYEGDQLACMYPQMYCNLNFLGGCPYCQNGNYPRVCIDIRQEDCEDLAGNCEGGPEVCNLDSRNVLYDTYEDCVEGESQYWCCGGWDWKLYRDEPIFKPEESCHVLYYFSVDNLGNVEPINVNCFFVDNTAPQVDKSIGDPKVENGEIYISSQTPITLSCWDIVPHPVDHVSLWYRYRFAEDCEDLDEAQWTEWIDPNGHVVEKTIYFPEDSCHELEYYCEDGLGNEGEHKFEIDIVDNQAPVIEKTINGPSSGDCLPKEEGDICYIDGVTTISVDVRDPEPHPVNDVTCRWGYTVDGGDFIIGGQGLGHEFTVTFPEESKHNLIIECIDALGNKVHDEEIFYVDKTPPAITKNYGEPFEFYQFDTYEAKWISSNTTITAGVTDDGTHKSGIAEVKYRTTKFDDNEKCKYYYPKDTVTVGKIETFSCDETEGSGDWTYVDPEDFDEFTFNIGQDSCHLIEIMATDKVGKCSLHKQWVYVDNQPPTPNKTIGEPKAKWNGADAEFYPDIKDKCWSLPEEQCTDPEVCLKCWKVTEFTPIKLDCIDPQPHPVDQEKICFKVDVDAEDKTNEYCSEYGESMNDDGFCCVEDIIPEFRFLEDTEHELEYYCVDKLGNTNKKLDIQKFKVEGTEFKIPLYEKWNLISVPYVLLDNSIEKVFESVKENITSVWKYDAAEDKWYDWSPGDAPDSFDEIDPGWGYWVVSKDGTCYDPVLITIGGYLFSGPGTTPPSRTLKSGWNLIGYYGTHWQWYDWESNLEPWGHFCGYPLPWDDFSKWVYGGNAYCALGSLAAQIKYQPSYMFLTLEGYINCGDHKDHWYPIGLCTENTPIEDTVFGRMYAGRGYWIHMPLSEDGEKINYEYAPYGSLTCPWDKEIKCIADLPMT